MPISNWAVWLGGRRQAAGGGNRPCYLACVVLDDALLNATFKDRSVDVDFRALLLRGTYAAVAAHRKQLPLKQPLFAASS